MYAVAEPNAGTPTRSGPRPVVTEGAAWLGLEPLSEPAPNVNPHVPPLDPDAAEYPRILYVVEDPDGVNVGTPVTATLNPAVWLLTSDRAMDIGMTR
jgi:hypothetical protein